MPMRTGMYELFSNPQFKQCMVIFEDQSDDEVVPQGPSLLPRAPAGTVSSAINNWEQVAREQSAAAAGSSGGSKAGAVAIGAVIRFMNGSKRKTLYPSIAEVTTEGFFDEESIGMHSWGDAESEMSAAHASTRAMITEMFSRISSGHW